MISSFMLTGAGVNTGSKFAKTGEIFTKLTLPVSLSVDSVVGNKTSKVKTIHLNFKIFHNRFHNIKKCQYCSYSPIKDQ